MRLIDEGMTMAQTLMEEAQTLDQLKMAQTLFNDFHALRWLYKQIRPDGGLKY